MTTNRTEMSEEDLIYLGRRLGLNDQAEELRRTKHKVTRTKIDLEESLVYYSRARTNLEDSIKKIQELRAQFVATHQKKDAEGSSK